MAENTKLRFRFSPASLSVKLPLYLVLFCLIINIVNGTLGYRIFKSLFEKQYKDITEQIAATALSYIDREKLQDYACGWNPDQAWEESNRRLDELTVTAELAYIYVTIPDKEYNSRVYIFDTVNPQIRGAKKIECGHVSSLKKYDAEYIASLKKVMEKGQPYIRYVYKETGGHVTTSIPVCSSSGEVIAIMSVVKPMSELRSFKEDYIRFVAVNSLMLTAGFIVIFLIVLLVRVIHPIKIITRETSQFARQGGKLSESIKKIKGHSELAVLARSVEKMSVDMNNYIDVLTKTTAEKERLSAEIDVARQIQANMLPRIFPPYAAHPELELYAIMEPAKEVGGDFYDFFVIDDDHFAVLVGDVSGKGVPAALFMVIAKTLLKNVAMQSYSPAEVFEKVNAQLCEGNDALVFVTCWMGIFTLSKGSLEFANAGHTKPVIRRGDDFSFLESSPDLMLAVNEKVKYRNNRVDFKPGDRLFLYTDGVTEAENSSQQLYGEERLLEYLRAIHKDSPRELLEALRSNIEEFSGDAPQFDDITMLEFSIKKRQG
ncbi:PP2C family protein-serine/threonine phosphatase [Treponema sp.]|uniref:PP2C family protein-serine/threonine phosphatase n=1 Tax=Treponema sp. TaxID=166 RepID=UPI0025DF4078|nr:PP2C family protein-serine/threonine phosphatase [Treponema sp.]MCR5218104.1 SpoIIE family protein phosphatase [Treponema sp.]